MRWQVTYLNAVDRSTVRTQIDGDSTATIAGQLARDGKILIGAKPMLSLSAFLPRAPVRFDVALFCEELKALLLAGLSLVEALEALQANEFNASAGAVYGRVLAQVLQGRRLSDALESVPVFNSVLVSAVRGSEHTSGVADALGRYLDYDRRLDDLRNRVISAMIYPSLVLGLGIAIILFLLGYVVPSFATIYTEHATHVATGTRVILELGQTIARHAWVLAACLLVAVIAVGRSLIRIARGQAALDVVQRFSLLKAPIVNLERARVFETLAIVLRGGFTLPYAVDVARGVTLTRKTRLALDRVRRRIEAGGSLDQALRTQRIGDEVAIRLAAAGGEAGSLPDAMQHAAEHYARRFARAVDRLTRLAEPVLMIIVGAVIGAIVLMMYLPIFDLATSIGG